MCNNRHKYICGTVTPIKKLTLHTGNMCRTWGSTSQGNCKRYQCWGDRIYIKRDWFGTVMDKNYGVTKGNERLMGEVTAR